MKYERKNYLQSAFQRFGMGGLFPPPCTSKLRFVKEIQKTIRILIRLDNCII